VGFEVLMSVTIQITVFWVITPHYSEKRAHCFEEICCCLSGLKSNPVHCAALKMEIYSCRMLAHTRVHGFTTHKLILFVTL
jgi:hypothetical protein